jgi:hypothetical protein
MSLSNSHLASARRFPHSLSHVREQRPQDSADERHLLPDSTRSPSLRIHSDRLPRSDPRHQYLHARHITNTSFCKPRKPLDANICLLFAPTLDVIRKIAVALSVSADELIFDENERGPQDDLRLQFEAVSKFSAEEKKVIKSVLEGLILKREAKRWSSAS